MAGKNWREVTRGGAAATPAVAQTQAPTTMTAAPAQRTAAVSPAEVSPKLATLMA